MSVNFQTEHNAANVFAILSAVRSQSSDLIEDDASSIFLLEKNARTSKNSSKYVALFRYLKKHDSTTNEDVSSMLKYGHSSTTSKFLGEIAWIERSGKSVASKWALIRKYV